MDSSDSESSAHSTNGIDISAIQNPVVLIGGHNKWEWMFLLFGMFNAATLIASAVIVITQECPVFQPRDYCSMLEAITASISVISLLFALNGVHRERMYDMYLHCIWIAVGLFCSWVNYFIISDKHHIRLIMNSAVSCVGLVNCLIAFKATHVPDWIEFRLIGVSDPLALMYKNLCHFLAVLKFNSIFVVLFALYSAEVVFEFDSWTLWYSFQGLIVIYALLLWILGKFAVQKEDHCFVYSFYVLTSCYTLAIICQLCWSLMRIPAKREELILCSSSVTLGIILVLEQSYMMMQLRKAHIGFGYGLNSTSFRELVSRNSSSLFASSRSAVFY